MSPLIHRPARNRYSGFSLVEAIVAVLIIGAVLGMIMTALVMMDHAVANEKTVNLNENGKHTALYTAGWLNSMGYWESYSTAGPVFNVAPSRAADAQAEALWSSMHDLYEQSTTVLVLPVYVINNITLQTFIGNQGYLSQDIHNGKTINAPPIPYNQLINWQSTASMTATYINSNVKGATFNTLIGWQTGAGYTGPLSLIQSIPAAAGNFDYWGDASYPIPSIAPDKVDPTSLRCATIYFLAPHDRILGILRMRAYQFTGSDPYRYYEVALDHISWKNNNPTAGANSASYSTTNLGLTEDYVYRFVEDKNYPQDLIFPPTQSQTQTIEGGGSWPTSVLNTPSKISYAEYQNEFIRLATPGENYTPGTPLNAPDGEWINNINPAASRRQVSLAYSDLSNSTLLPARTDEWHLILPDPGTGQAEERANIYQNPNMNSPDVSTSPDWNIRRQGKYGCVLSLYP